MINQRVSCISVDIINADKPAAGLAFLAGACEMAKVDYNCVSINSTLLDKLTQENFNQVGESATNILDEQGIEHAIKYVASAHSLRTIRLSQVNKLCSILHKLSSDIKKQPVKLSHNPYAKSEPRFEKSEVSNDVKWAFRNWKK